MKEFFKFEFKTKIFFSVKIFIAQSKSLNQSNLTHGIAIKEIMCFKVKKNVFCKKCLFHTIACKSIKNDAEIEFNFSV